MSVYYATDSELDYSSLNECKMSSHLFPSFISLAISNVFKK